jgi:hypothetical protein
MATKFSQDHDTTKLFDDMTELRVQIGILIHQTQRGVDNAKRIRDLWDQLAQLTDIAPPVRFAVQRERLRPSFVAGAWHYGKGNDTEPYEKPEEEHFRYFVVCLDGWREDGLAGDRCMRMQGMRQFFVSRTLTHGKPSYCDCGAKVSNQVIVEIRQGEKYWYMRAPYPNIDILDIRGIAIRNPYGKLTPAHLQMRLPIYSKCLVTHQAEGLMHFHSHAIFLTLPQFEWESIFQIQASLE